MDEQHLGEGILFYSTVYIAVVLLSVAITTGRWIFLLLILLTFALAGYMAYLTINDTQHLKTTGKWVENFLKSMYEKVAKTIS